MLEMLGAVWTHDHEKERPAEVPDNHGSRNKSRNEKGRRIVCVRERGRETERKRERER